MIILISQNSVLAVIPKTWLHLPDPFEFDDTYKYKYRELSSFFFFFFFKSPEHVQHSFTKQSPRPGFPPASIIRWTVLYASVSFRLLLHCQVQFPVYSVFQGHLLAISDWVSSLENVRLPRRALLHSAFLCTLWGLFGWLMVVCRTLAAGRTGGRASRRSPTSWRKSWSRWRERRRSPGSHPPLPPRRSRRWKKRGKMSHWLTYSCFCPVDFMVLWISK